MHFAVQILEFLLLGLLCLCALSGLKLLRSTGKNGSSRGFLQVHGATIFQRRQSVNAKRRQMAMGTETRNARNGALTAATNQYAVLNFNGDVRASGKDGFALLVDEVEANKEKFKGAIVVVNSPGGGVAEYGQMYAEMLRLRKASIDVTVCVDTYAASGGYLMSLPANRIVAAPFAYVGSVGVVTEFPNFHKLLKNIGVEPQTFTAGNMKRTITSMSDPDDADKRAALQAKLEKIHEQFRAMVLQHRPNVNPELLNGDSWTAQETMNQNMGLVDDIATSEEYLFRLNQENDLVMLGFKKNRFEGGLMRLVTGAIDHALERAETRLFKDKF